MKSIVQHLREEKNLTQTELAEKSGLSLRTIQRIEAGNVPKGYTLKALAFFFETEPEKLIPNKVILNVERAKLINICSLSGIGIILGVLIVFPPILFSLVFFSAVLYIHAQYLLGSHLNGFIS